MKALTKNLLTAACLVTAAFSLNACISNNGNDIDSTVVPLTPAEKTTQIHAMAGTYTGKARLYTSPNGRLIKSDSAVVHFTVGTDSIITVKDFPVRLFALNAANGTVKTALEKLTAEFTSDIRLYSQSNYIKNLYGGNAYFFILWPQKLGTGKPWMLSYPYTHNSAAQTLTATFVPGGASVGLNYNSLNLYYKPKKALQFFLILKEIKLSDGTMFDNSQGRAFILVEGKK